MSGIVNINSANLLRLGALGAGVFYGYAHKQSLTAFVHKRSEERARLHNLDLVDEAKIAFEAQESRETAARAKKAGLATIDNDSWRYDAERYMNFLLSETEAEAPKPKKK
ncbi:uncharacterized protein EV422DRAFT_144611 [Fimicolochytrium jonesii]|uniref:uncharacterized protein n=1 Tax=Fimicolochytrium jonesii TaxID=1396493 RepID=UPI0022FE6561|nr:uncharacterized protein EV422DRAFT_144611 [Fimicolochytrium jonesii]KAI8825875.1 hypothetical protein EV422DRAFT_144611 [Fimicolochytrium jonesii]